MRTWGTLRMLWNGLRILWELLLVPFYCLDLWKWMHSFFILLFIFLTVFITAFAGNVLDVLGIHKTILTILAVPFLFLYLVTYGLILILIFLAFSEGYGPRDRMLAAVFAPEEDTDPIIRRE